MAAFSTLHKKPIAKKTSRKFKLQWLRWLLAPILALILLQVWINAAEAEDNLTFLLPHPQEVLDRLEFLHERDRLMLHVEATTEAAIKGLRDSLLLALPLGYIVARNKWISALLMPYLVAIRAIPVVAIAALITVRFGTGIESKIVVVIFITWFTLMEATIVGIQSVDPKLRELMRSYGANPLQIFLKLELPSAMPNLLSGLKIAVTLAVVGAAVGELISSREGLAYLITLGRGTGDSALVFGAVILLTTLSIVLYGSVAIAERFLLAWRHQGETAS